MYFATIATLLLQYYYIFTVV